MNQPERDPNEILTSIQAAEELKVDPATTRKAAAAGDGRVEGAHQEARPGTINPPWVAARAAWQKWFANRRPAGRPKEEAEIRPLGAGFTAVIGPYRKQYTGSSAGLRVYEPAQAIQLVRDHGTDRQTIWGDTTVSQTVWDRDATNQMGQKGAIQYVRPAPEKVDATTSELFEKAMKDWKHAQQNIWVIAVNHDPVGMVRTPLSRFAADDAGAHGALLKPLPDEEAGEERNEVLPLDEAWRWFERPRGDEYRSEVQNILVKLIRNRTYEIERQTGTQMSALGFEEYVKKANTLDTFRPLVLQALNWLQGLTAEMPPGVETGAEFRHKYWGPKSPYSRM